MYPGCGTTLKYQLKKTTQNLFRQLVKAGTVGVSLSLMADMFQKMTSHLHTCQLEWQYLEAVEQPRVVNIVAAEFTTADNWIGQVALRIHSKQVTTGSGALD